MCFCRSNINCTYNYYNKLNTNLNWCRWYLTIIIGNQTKNKNVIFKPFSYNYLDIKQHNP